MPGFRDAFRSRRVALFIPIGFGAGLPLLLSGQTLQAWMTAENVSLKTIGIFGLVMLPYNFKFLWAPLLDRYRLPWLGRRRGWIVLAQLLVAGAIAFMGTLDPKNTTYAVATAAVALAFLSASQDIVVDAYRADVLPDHERASGAATYVMGYRIAILVAGAFALMLSEHLPWRTIYFGIAGLMAIGVVGTVVAPEPTAAAKPPRTLLDAVIKPLADLFRRRGVLFALFFILLYKFGDAVAEPMITPFLNRSLGFSMGEIGLLRKFVGFFATITGALLGGGLVVRLGMLRSLLIFGVLQAATNVTYLFLAVVGKSYALLVASVTLDNLASGLGTSAFVAYLMSLCDKRFSAFQYALLGSVSSIMGRLVGTSSGWVATSAGWPVFFGATIAAAIPALALVPLLRGVGAPATEPAPAVAPAPEPRPARAP